VTRLRQLKQRVQQFDRSTRIATQLENQALWLEQMNRVVAEMKLTVRHLKSSVESLQEHLRFNHSSLRFGHQESPFRRVSGTGSESLMFGCEAVVPYFVTYLVIWIRIISSATDKM
jgi:hypothetical protein